MTLEDLAKIPTYQTKAISHAAEDPATALYLMECLGRFWAGDYGEICEEDTQYNNDDLSAGYGHVLARYKGKFKLTGDIYIESHFDQDNLTDIDYTNTLIMYPEER